MLSPFPPSTSTSGRGILDLTLRPPNLPVFSTLSYSYPLKLVVSAPHNLPPLPTSPTANDSNAPPPYPSCVPLLFLLTYGGGLVSDDHIHLTVTLAPSTRLTLATQGSTKIFRPPDPDSTTLTTQDLVVRVGAKSALCLMPDPCQPYARSRYAQKQVFEVDVLGGGSLCVLDWVCEGRSARGEIWECEEWRGRNELWDVGNISSSKDTGSVDKQEKERRLLLRDNLILSNPSLRDRVDNMALFGTMILLGPLVAALADFFVEEFGRLPRIGGRDWGDHTTSAVSSTAPATEEERKYQWRKKRQSQEKEDGVLWTAARVRGAVVVKFGARDVEAGRRWLGATLREEGTIGREFGEGGLMCLR